MDGRVKIFGEAWAKHTADDGSVRTFYGKNVVHEEGLRLHLNFFSQNSSTRSLYLGLMPDGETIASADTLGDRASSEITNYDQSNRPEWLPGTPASTQSVDNSGNVAVYTVNSQMTTSGPFLSDLSTKEGTDGVLVSSVTFDGGDAALSSGTLEVTYKHSAST